MRVKSETKGEEEDGERKRREREGGKNTERSGVDHALIAQLDLRIMVNKLLRDFGLACLSSRSLQKQK